MDNKEKEPIGRKPILTHIIDPKLRKGIKNYIFQSLIATGVCCVMLISLDVLIPGALVASLGASTFIVFVAPDSLSAKPRNLLGGQLIGTGVGMACSLMLAQGFLTEMLTLRMETAIIGSVAIGLAIFLMVIIDMEHPPAAGTALSLVVSEWNVYSIAFIGGASIFLSFARWALGRRLKNLY